MEDYKQYYVNGLNVSEKEYEEALEDGEVEVRKITYRDGKILSDVIQIPSTKDFNEHQMYIDDYHDWEHDSIEERDMVNSPDHYTVLMEKLKGLEVIDLAEIISDEYPAHIRHHIATTIKYILRAPFKDNLEQDLEKSVWYLNRALKRLGDDIE